MSIWYLHLLLIMIEINKLSENAFHFMSYYTNYHNKTKIIMILLYLLVKNIMIKIH